MIKRLPRRLLGKMPEIAASGERSVSLIRWMVPTQERIAELHETVAQLEARGGKLDLRTCGDKPPRLCVRVDPNAPHYGEGGDYYVIKGY